MLQQLLMKEHDWAIHNDGSLREFARLLPQDPVKVQTWLEQQAYRRDEIYSVLPGRAFIPISGTMIYGCGFIGRYCCDQQVLADEVRKAAETPRSRAAQIVLFANSGGGTVAGTELLAEAVKYAASKKPVIVITGSTMASACYWACVHATKIIAPRTGVIGSIGAKLTFLVWQKYDERFGIETVNYDSGDFKSMGTDHRLPTEKEAARLQEHINETAAIFFEHVAEGRKLDVKTVKGFEANIFNGDEAKANGLVDEVRVVDVNRPADLRSVLLSPGLNLHSPTQEAGMSLIDKLKGQYPGQEEVVAAVYHQTVAEQNGDLEDANTRAEAAETAKSEAEEQTTAEKARADKAEAAITAANETVADTIWTAALDGSGIPDSFADLAKGTVKAEDHLAENGVIDTESFQTAVTGKVEALKKDLPAASSEDEPEAGSEVEGLGGGLDTGATPKGSQTSGAEGYSEDYIKNLG